VANAISKIKAGASDMLAGIKSIVRGDRYYEFATPEGIIFSMADDEIPLAARSIIDDIVDLENFAKANGVSNLSSSFEDILKFSGGRLDLAKKLILSTKEVIEGKTIPELVEMFNLAKTPSPASLSSYQTRIWYKWQEYLIGGKLNYAEGLEQAARQAYELRNGIRTLARQSMSDREWAEYLLQNERNMTFEELVQKNIDRGLSGDDIWNKIIESSMSSRDSVDALFKLN